MKGVLGAGAGAKLLSRYGFFGELYTGLSRLIDNTGLGSFPYYSHTGLTLGKRF